MVLAVAITGVALPDHELLAAVSGDGGEFILSFAVTQSCRRIAPGTAVVTGFGDINLIAGFIDQKQIIAGFYHSSAAVVSCGLGGDRFSCGQLIQCFE